MSSLDLDCGDWYENNADWWILRLNPSGSFAAYDLNTLAFSGPLGPTYQGPLFDFAPVPLVNAPQTMEGRHIYYFGVDTMMNRVIDFDRLFYDYVAVDIHKKEDSKSFNGVWSGKAISTTNYDRDHDVSGHADMTFTVEDTSISGYAVDYPWGERYAIFGSITEDGKIRMGLGYGNEGTVAQFSGTLSDSSGSGTWKDNYECRGTWSVQKQ